MDPQEPDPLLPPSATRGVRRGPVTPDRLPDWNLGVSTHDRQASYFDSEGRPRIASAREVAPPEDNPLWWGLRLGERLALLTMNGRAIWPGNVHLNPLSFYLIGKMRGGLVEDLLALLPFLLLLAIDVLILYGWFITLDVVVLVLGILASLILFAPLMGLWVQMCQNVHFRRVRDHVPLDELALTRLKSIELLYGLIVRPLSALHLFNVAPLVLALVLIGSLALNQLGFVLQQSGGRAGEAELFGGLTALLLVGLRWVSCCVAINTALAQAIRARLYIKSTPLATRRMTRDWFSIGFGLPIHLPLGAALVVAAAALVDSCSAFLLLVIVCWVEGRLFLSVWRETAQLYRLTARHDADWWLRSREETTRLPRAVTEIL